MDMKVSFKTLLKSAVLTAGLAAATAALAQIIVF